MKPLEMIAEWRKGCTCGGPVLDQMEGAAPGTHSPAECVECTVALIEALESVLRAPNEDMIAAGSRHSDWDYRNGRQDCEKAAAEVFQQMSGATEPETPEWVTHG
jgi:hypothetical protein